MSYNITIRYEDELDNKGNEIANMLYDYSSKTGIVVITNACKTPDCCGHKKAHKTPDCVVIINAHTKPDCSGHNKRPQDTSLVTKARKTPALTISFVNLF